MPAVRRVVDELFSDIHIVNFNFRDAPAAALAVAVLALAIGTALARLRLRGFSRYSLGRVGQRGRVGQ